MKIRNGFHKTDKMALDGDRFSLSICMEDDTSLSASGYMRRPRNFAVVADGPDSLFAPLLTEQDP